MKNRYGIENTDAEMLYVGHLSRDFGGFLCALN
jgi:hypothetical protein